MQSATSFVNGFLDAELCLDVSEISTPKPERKSRIAILCSPLYSRSADFQDCVHWIPGWCGDEIPDEVNKDALVEAIVNENTEKVKRRIASLNLERDQRTCLVEKASLEGEIEHLTVQTENLRDLLQSLWNDFNIIAKPTLCDGNCGVHMAMAFGEDVPSAALTGKEAASEDILQIVRAYRNELSEMWCQVAEDCLWQQIWQRFIEGRVDLRHWQKLAQPVSTPPRKKRRKSMSMTPEGKKTAEPRLKGRLVSGDGVEVRPEAVPVVMENQTSSNVAADEEQLVLSTEQPKEKVKPTGKRLPAEKFITFSKALGRVLSENNLTYKNFIAAHREKRHVLVFLGRRCFH